MLDAFQRKNEPETDNHPRKFTDIVIRLDRGANEFKKNIPLAIRHDNLDGAIVKSINEG